MNTPSKVKNLISSLLAQGKNPIEIAQELNLNKSSLYVYIFRNFNISFKKEAMLKKYKKEILNMYNNGVTCKEIATFYNCQYQNVNTFIRKEIGSLMPSKGNVRYFSKIDTYNKAYFLGFIAADGCLTKTSYAPNYTLSITLHSKDKIILEKLKEEIGNTHKLKRINTISSFNGKPVDHIRYSITDKFLSNDLIKLGIAPNKSLNMSNIILNVPKEYRKAFIIGYFDGDGSVTKPKDCLSRRIVNIRGTEEFLKGIVNELDLDMYKISKYDSISTLTFGNKPSINKFFNCYNYCEFYLKRKFIKFK